MKNPGMIRGYFFGALLLNHLNLMLPKYCFIC